MQKSQKNTRKRISSSPGMFFLKGSSYPLCAVIVLAPIAGGQVGIGHGGAGVGGVDELSVSDVDAHVGHIAGRGCDEEHQITRLEVVLGHTGADVDELGGRSAGYAQTQIFQNIVYEAGAVKAAGACAACHIGSA